MKNQRDFRKMVETGVDPRLSGNIHVGAFLMARLDLLIYHCIFPKINRPTSNRRLLNVSRLIILEKSREKRVGLVQGVVGSFAII